MSTPTNPRWRRGFTLIELLVVIAIIAILAAILFPVFAQAREKARQAACLSNLKQMGTAVMMYSQDFDETLPLGYSSPLAATGRTWMHFVMPYAKNRDIWTCPSAPNLRAPTNLVNNGTGGYGCNRNVMESGRARTIAEIGNPAGTFIICDTAQLGATPAPTADNVESWDKLVRTTGNPYTDWQVTAPTGYSPNPGTGYASSNTANYELDFGQYGDPYRRPVPRHNIGVSIIYADGHAKWSRITQFLGIPQHGLRGWPYSHANNSWDDQ
jgi:prepilin-type N-terminal cleavage/methylation domain-containing protein